MKLVFFCLVFGVGMIYLLFNAVTYTSNALGFG